MRSKIAVENKKACSPTRFFSGDISCEYTIKIEIIYNAPIQFSPDESQGFSFYREEIRLEKYNAVIGVFEYKEVSIVSMI